ncbi:glycosyltransferase family 4 protein [Chloroflexota bacterium]
MKILTISPTYELGRVSGVFTVIKNICEILVKRGHICKVLAINRENSNDVDDVINGVTVKRIGSPGSKYLYGLSPEMYRYIKNSLSAWIRQDDIDIIHVHMYHNMLSLQSVYQLKNYGKPVIFTPHYHAQGHNRLTSLLLNLYHPVGKQIFKHVHKVVGVSEYEAVLIRNAFSTAEGKIKVIPHGISISDIQPRKKKASASPHINLLFVGRMEEHKGVQHILRAMQRLKNSYRMQPVLDIVGEGRYKEHVVELARDLGLEHDVIWNKFLTDEELQKKYRNTDIFLLPSQFEAYGLVVAEALASGIPSIVCDTSALTEFITEAGCFGIKYPPEPEEFARMIVDIHKSDVQVGPFNPAKIRTWEKAVDEYEQLYQQFS